jgi:dTDP-4-dehydrorhamnose reductase
MTQLQLWGGVECTIARIGEEFRNQLEETGHRRRPDDISLIAGLGIRTLRYPILWEQHEPEDGGAPDYSWTDERLAQLRERGIEVIAGLLHHGSAPRRTNLLDPEFPRKFAEYAGEVAARYPWIRRWTPINEPLTTARFSCLYAHWYPHRRNYADFLTALVNQCVGVSAAMAAIRAVNPEAELVQTEDLGRTFATPPLRYQAEHDNHRRWLSLDLLCGRVDARHPMRSFLDEAGISPELLDALEAAPTPPDLIGINHYLTSDRFLDHRLRLYAEPAAGNGRDAYVDVEAVRIRHLAGQVGLAARLREAWRRYGKPLAVTEVHHGCTREQQLRWLAECWRTGLKLEAEGMDLRAITLWSLFGHYDWRSLLTRREGAYDSGAFDVRAETPRLTAIGRMATTIASGERPALPVLAQPGWWRRPERLYPWQGGRLGPPPRGRPLLITGATGTLGQALARICEVRGLPYRLSTRAELDICDERSIRAALARHRPWAVINAAGYVRVADAENERDACFAWNTHGPALLAGACAERAIPLVTFSSDLVFDGQRRRAYVESDPVNPRGVYGESKAEAERLVLEAHPRALVIRTAAFFGEWDQFNFAHHVLAALGSGERLRAAAEERVSPTYVPDLCHAALDLLIDEEAGIWHLANQGSLSWLEFARAVAEGAGHDPTLIKPTPGPARSTALDSVRGRIMRPFPEALAAYLAARSPTDLAEELLAAE